MIPSHSKPSGHLDAAGSGRRENPDDTTIGDRLLRRTGWWLALGLLAALGIAWILPAGVTLGAAHTDMVGQFIPWRAFAADTIRQGQFPFWNPFTYSGQPFLGGFQSALLYPPNAVFLLLPLERALTFTILAHLLILGAGVAYWCRRRGLHPGAGVTAGIAFALSGVVFPHVYAGHLSNLCTMAWVPWAFAGLEQAWRGRRAAGLLLASAAIALQILAGQVQYVFFFGVAAGVHAVVVMLLDASARWRALPILAAACVAGACLAAAQILPGLEAGQESVRQGALDYRFASAFALPPENLFTALVPEFFGEVEPGGRAYWGRCYLWEMSIYLGMGAVFFAAAGFADHAQRARVRIDLIAAALLLLVALGRHLPLYGFLYAHVPGFAQFRGMSKFTFPAMLLVSLAAAAGMDALLRGRWQPRWFAIAALCVAVLLGGLATWLHLQPDAVRTIFDWIRARATNDLIAPPTFPSEAGAHAVRSLLQASGLCLALGTCLFLARSRPAARWAAVALVPLDLLLFARGFLATTPVAAAMPQELRDFVVQNPGDYRVLNLLRPNGGHLLGAPDIWGNDPGVLKRYAEFMTFTQGGDPGQATQNLGFSTIDRLYAMLRCRYAFVSSADRARIVAAAEPMSRVTLVSEYQVHRGRDAVLAALKDPAFDPRIRVILEEEPSPVPAPGEPVGAVRIVAETVNSLTLDAELERPGVLLITDLYSKGWRATARNGSVQARYRVLPANYILQAVPLSAGTHRLHLEYRPHSFALGVTISAVALVAWGAALLFLCRRTGAAPVA